MAKVDRCSFAMVNQLTDISRTTFHRAIGKAEVLFGVRIEYVRSTKVGNQVLPPGNSGYFHVTDWGYLNKEALIKHVDSLIAQGLID